MNDSLRKKLAAYYKIHPNTEVNFILSHIDTLACFCASNDPFHGIIAVTDAAFNPIFSCETNASPQACGISDNGCFAIFQLANSPNSDSSCTYFVDASQKEIIWCKPISPNWKSVTSYVIDDKNSRIYEHHDNNGYVVKYDFGGNTIDKRELLFQRIKGNDCSPYELNRLADELVAEMDATGLDNQKLKDIEYLINSILSFDSASLFQLAETRRALGNLYYKNALYENAMECYQKALENNPKIAVKKKIKELQRLLK